MHNNIKIFVDQSVILPDGIIEEFNIGIIPIRIMNEKGEEYTGKRREEIIEGLKRGEKYRTSVLSPGRVIKIFENVKGEIISFHVSSELSGIISTMNVVKKRIKRIEPVDTKTAGPCSGMGVLAGIKAWIEGKSKEEIIKTALNVSLNSKVFMAVPETLRLARIRPVEGIKKFISHPSLFLKFLRTPFGFPIITIEGNKLKIYDFSKSFKDASKKMMEGMREYIKERNGKLYVFVFFSEKDDKIENFEKEIRDEFKPIKLY